MMSTANDHKRDQRGRSDSGATFIELLVSIVLLGLASIGVLTAIATTVQSTTAHDQVATAQAQLSDVGDVLSDSYFDEATATDPHYEPCATVSQYNAAIDPVTGYWTAQAAAWSSVTVTAVDFWNGAAWLATTDASCVGDELQRVTLQATVDGHTRQLSVVKREATAADSGGSYWNDDMVAPAPNCAFTGTCP